MLRKYSSILFVCLFVLLAGLFGYKFFKKTEKNETPAAADPRTINLPIALDNPSVGSAFVHYFISGKLKEVVSTANGLKLVLEESSGLPELLTNPQTRISKITPPYSSATSVAINVNSLKSGQTIDLSIEYDLRSNTWIVQDVFLPTDRNNP